MQLVIPAVHEVINSLFWSPPVFNNYKIWSEFLKVKFSFKNRVYGILTLRGIWPIENALGCRVSMTVIMF
jgi:hypothetical protein